MVADAFICSFSGSVVDIPRGRRDSASILRALSKDPWISTFDMSENAWLWKSIDQLLKGGLLIEHKEPYPGHRYELTPAGRAHFESVVM